MEVRVKLDQARFIPITSGALCTASSPTHPPSHLQLQANPRGPSTLPHSCAPWKSTSLTRQVNPTLVKVAWLVNASLVEVTGLVDTASIKVARFLDVAFVKVTRFVDATFDGN